MWYPKMLEKLIAVPQLHIFKSQRLYIYIYIYICVSKFPKNIYTYTYIYNICILYVYIYITVYSFFSHLYQRGYDQLQDAWASVATAEGWRCRVFAARGFSNGIPHSQGFIPLEYTIRIGIWGKFLHE